MRTFSLDQLTVLGVRPAEMVEIAARAGYGAICPFAGIGHGFGLPTVPLRAGDPDTVAMARALRDTGVFINSADGFALYEGVPMDEMRAAVDLMAQLGARHLVTLNFDSDDARAEDNFGQLYQWARAAGLRLLLEFTPLSRIAGLADALAWRERTGAQELGLVVDLLHLNKSGGSPADLAALDPALIGGAQLCDGPLAPTEEEYAEAAVHERMVPGEGELPCRAFLAALPADLVVGVEVPLSSRAKAGEGHLARAAMVLEAARAMDR